MALKRIAARFLVGMSTEELWDTLTGRFILVFDDGEIETDYRETLYSSYVWDFHRLYPETPMLKIHHVQAVLAGGRLGSGTHLELLGNVMWSTHDEYVDKGKKLYALTTGREGWKMPAKGAAARFHEVDERNFRDHLSEMLYRTSNKMYNDLIYRLPEFVVSLDVTDFNEVMRHPKVRAANDSLQPTQKSIDDTYGIIRGVLLNGVDLPNNPISLASRSKLVSIEQVLQCVSARGFLTDTDSELFRKPVLRGYAQGIRSLHDSIIESRSAAKALIFSKTPLQQAEYFSRRLQLMSQILQNLHPGDCGSEEYLIWSPRENGEVSSSDLKQLAGKYYLDEESKKLKIIRPGDGNLLRKSLKIRTVLHCRCEDPYGVCATCFGELSLSVPEGTNLGQMCCTSLAQKSSQNVLSVKHLDGSSVVEGIALNYEERRYLKAAPDGNSYMLADRLKGLKVTLVIPADKAANLTDIKEVKNVEDLNITRISELDTLGMVVEDPAQPDVSDKPVLDVSLNRRLSSMTYAMLGYVRKHGWSVNERGNYTIDMSEWDWSQAILTLPLKHFNMSDHSKDIATMLESSVEKMQERDVTVSADAALMELFDLVNKKLSVNLAVLEVVLLASMIVSAENGMYDFPKPWTEAQLGVMKLSMAHRSASAAMAFENHREFITSPLSFTETNRPDHPFDAVLMPGEVQAAKGWS